MGAPVNIQDGRQEQHSYGIEPDEIKCKNGCCYNAINFLARRGLRSSDADLHLAPRRCGEPIAAPIVGGDDYFDRPCPQILVADVLRHGEKTDTEAGHAIIRVQSTGGVLAFSAPS